MNVYRGYLLAAGSIVLTTFAQLAMKWGMVRLPALGELASSLEVWWQAWPALFPVGLGILAYLLSMLCWLLALSYLPLNKAYPLLSISYVLVYLATAILPWFRETFSIGQTLGVLLISLGVWLVVSPTGNRPAH